MGVCPADRWKLNPKRLRAKWDLGPEKIEFCSKEKGGQNGSTYISLNIEGVLEQSTSGDYAGCFLSPERELRKKKKFAREIKYGGAQDVNICQNTTRKKVVFLSILGDVKSDSIGYSYLWKILTMDDEFEAAFEDELEALQEMEGCFLLSINPSFMHSFILFVLRNTNVHKICLSVWYSSLFCNMSDRILYSSVWSRLSVTATLKVSWLSAIYCWARLVALITGLGYLDGISRCSPIAFLYARGAMEHAHSIGTCNWGTLGFWLW